MIRSAPTRGPFRSARGRRLVPARIAAAFLLVACLLAASRARAAVVIEALGTAPIGAASPDAARQRAQDDAFRQAVDQAIATLVAPGDRQAHAQTIRTRVLRRARAYVTRYRVLEEGENDGVYQVRIEATVESGTLGADLRALGIPLLGDAGDPPGAGAASPGRPKLALLCLVRDGERVSATFGSGADGGGPIATALAAVLRAEGFEVVTAPGRLPPVAAGREAEQELPLDDAQAAELARAASAGVAVVVGAELRDGGRIRGTRLEGAEVRLLVRVLDVTAGGATPVAGTRVSDAGFGADAAEARAFAARAAVSRAARALLPRLSDRWPDLRGAQGVAVRVRGADRWALVEDVLRALRGAPGVKEVSIVRLARQQVTLLVRGPVRAQVVSEAIASASSTGAPPIVRIGGERLVDVEQPAEEPEGFR